MVELVMEREDATTVPQGTLDPSLALVLALPASSVGMLRTTATRSIAP
jgi:hypothetical protein